jgi:hypothetical protein
MALSVYQEQTVYRQPSWRMSQGRKSLAAAYTGARAETEQSRNKKL